MMSTLYVSVSTSIPAEPLSAPHDQYPFIIIRLMSAVYQRERIEIRQGESAVHIGADDSYVQYPTPMTMDN